MVEVKYSGVCTGIAEDRSWLCTDHFSQERGIKRSRL